MPIARPDHLLEHYRIIAEEAFMGFITFNIASRECVFLNKRASELFETTIDDAKKSLTLDHMFAIEKRGDFKSFNEDLVGHEGLYQDVMVRRSDGQTFIANIGVKRLNIEDEMLVLLMVQDVTLQKKLQRDVVTKQIEIKAAYEELLKQNRQLKELDLAKNRFIALTTHELRTPLAAMVAAAEILHLNLYDTPEQMKEFIAMIYEQGNHLHELVNDILDFAKIQAGKMDFYIELHHPEALARSITEGFGSMAEVQGITLKVEAAPASAKCYYDDLRLHQVLSNMINNAIKYNRQNGSVRISFEDGAEFVKIFVKDTGHGIAPEQIEKVFNEFETLGQVSQHHKGTGLGMPISRRLMQGMGGHLQVESIVDKGSNFWVEIPKNKVLAAEVYRPRPSGASGDLAA
jgi:PAS domain S-box-containing protein